MAVKVGDIEVMGEGKLGLIGFELGLFFPLDQVSISS